MTFAERYDKISKVLIKADVSKYTENFAIQITLDDEDCGGTFFVAFNEGTFRVEPYDYVDNTASMNILALDLNKLADKRMEVQKAKEEGIVTINGNVEHIIMFFNGFSPKTAAKKIATKSYNLFRMSSNKSALPESRTSRIYLLLQKSGSVFSNSSK